ncbi:MAG: ABC transporter transmembrane domain-containing protein, partial [bacterium]|nr:ABC transporter transmembrane domain-containing protein [bacterium]
MKLLRFTARYLRPVWIQILIALVCLGVATWLNLKLPGIFGKDLLDKVFSSNDRSLLMNICRWIIAIFLIKGVLMWLQTYMMSFAGQRMILNMRNDLYGHLQELPIDFYEKRHTGEVISTLTNDINVVQGSLSGGILNIVQALSMLIGALVMMLMMDWQLTLLTLGVMPVMALVVGFFSNRIRGITDSIQRKLADITTIIQETVSGIRVVKSFSMEKHETKRFKVENEKNFQFVMRSAMASATLTPTMDLLFAIGAVVILWYGGLKVLHGILTAGEFIAFLGLLMLAASPMSMMSGYVNSLSQAAAALARLHALMQERREVKD